MPDVIIRDDQGRNLRLAGSVCVECEARTKQQDYRDSLLTLAASCKSLEDNPDSFLRLPKYPGQDTQYVAVEVSMLRALLKESGCRA